MMIALVRNGRIRKIGKPDLLVNPVNPVFILSSIIFFLKNCICNLPNLFIFGVEKQIWRRIYVNIEKSQVYYY